MPKIDWSYINKLPLEERVGYLKCIVEELTSIEDYEVGLGFLSKQQQRIVGRLLRSKGKTVRGEALRMAASLTEWGKEYPSDNALKSQICQIRKILTENNIPYVISNIRGMGYKLNNA